MAATTVDNRAQVAEPSGWIVFAGTMLVLVGTFNIIDALVALFNDKIYTVSKSGLIVWDFTAWGWIHLILGIVLVIAAFGLFAGRGWARWLAIVFAALNAIAQISFFTAYPLWSMLVIALDVIIIYQLTARWVPTEY
jgi:hypothetical protein